MLVSPVAAPDDPRPLRLAALPAVAVTGATGLGTEALTPPLVASHHRKVAEEERMLAFELAIDTRVSGETVVLDLGGGTGIFSFFAARAGARKVYCVERSPRLASAAQRVLASNGVADRVEVVIALDVGSYLPPEPVDVVICDVVHPGLLGENQLAMMASFKERHLERFGRAPEFIPEGVALAVQPIYADFGFHGYHAPMPMLVEGPAEESRLVDVGDQVLYAAFANGEEATHHFALDTDLAASCCGLVNALRLIHRNVLSRNIEDDTAIVWDLPDLVLPVTMPLEVMAGDPMHLRFRYQVGDDVSALAESIRVSASKEPLPEVATVEPLHPIASAMPPSGARRIERARA